MFVSDEGESKPNFGRFVLHGATENTAMIRTSAPSQISAFPSIAFFFK